MSIIFIKKDKEDIITNLEMTMYKNSLNLRVCIAKARFVAWTTLTAGGFYRPYNLGFVAVFVYCNKGDAGFE